jgi:hypothetical protein
VGIFCFENDWHWQPIIYLGKLYKQERSTTIMKESRQEYRTQENYALERGPPPLEKLLPEGLLCLVLGSKLRADL